MNELDAAYQEALEVAKTLPPAQASELVYRATLLYSQSRRAVETLDARRAELIASAKPIWVAM